MEHSCRVCGKDISDKVKRYSTDRFGVPLCRTHQDEVRNDVLDLNEYKNKETEMNTAKDTIDQSYIIKLQGKEFITHAGLLDIAHKKGLTKLTTELLESGETAIIRARAEFQDGTVFTGIGDANSENTNTNIAKHRIRMAETRAVNRALRFATNIGMCSVDELKDKSEVENGN